MLTPKSAAETYAVARTTAIFCVLAALCEGIDLQGAGVAAPGIAGMIADLHLRAEHLRRQGAGL